MSVEFAKFMNWVSASSQLWIFDGVSANSSGVQLLKLRTEILHYLRNVPSFVHPTAKVDPTATIRGNVAIDAGAQILPNASIFGPAYIGKQSVVGNYSVLRRSVFLAQNSVVGNHCYCNECVIGPSTRISHYVNFSRSIIAANSTLSAFVLTATTRADKTPVQTKSGEVSKIGCSIGPNTFIGPHTIISPDISIGARCYIAPYLNVTEDLEDDKYVHIKQTIEVRENKVSVEHRERPGNFSVSTGGPAVARHFCGALLVTDDGCFILQQRDAGENIYNSGRIGLFGGRRYTNETIAAAAKREILEETGMEISFDDQNPLADVRFFEPDGSEIQSTVFLVTKVKTSDIRQNEGRGFKVLTFEAAAYHSGVTPLARTAITEYVKQNFLSAAPV